MSDEPDFVTRFPDILAPFVPTPPDVVERMLELANTGGDDFVADLGCGDGRILITAARKYGARGLGVDMEPYRIRECEANAKRAGVSELVSFNLQDALTLDLAEVTVVMLYLVEWSTDRLEPLIRKQVKTGTRIVSHNYPMRRWPPTKIEELVSGDGKKHTLYLWIAG